jgi:ABC-2 type transport system ATP-binding protein
VARHLFYDRLLEDYAEHPRTVILSTHLIDEVSNLLEHVLVIDEGRILIDQDAESLRGTATTVVGRAAAVDAFAARRDVIHREALGGLASATIAGIGAPERREAVDAGLELAPVSLQQLIVRMTSGERTDFDLEERA